MFLNVQEKQHQRADSRNIYCKQKHTVDVCVCVQHVCVYVNCVHVLLFAGLMYHLWADDATETSLINRLYTDEHKPK